MEQQIFNIIAGIAGLLGSFVLTRLWGALDEIRKDHARLTSKHSDIEVLIAGAYVKREDLDRLGRDIFSKLDKIESKLDQKVDK